MAQLPDMEGEGIGMDEQEEEAESEKKIVESKIKMWNLNGYGAFQDSTKLDTLHDFFHVFHPVYKNNDTYTATFVGNYGTPALDNNFFNRNYNGSYYLGRSREAYFLYPATIDFYNTTTPYTRLDFSQSENKSKNNETRFNVIHSRNISPFWNFTFRTNQEKSDGQYNAQEAKNNFVSLHTSYNRDNWNIHGGFISNTIQNQENGGIEGDSLLLKGAKPEFWGTNLINSRTKLSNINYFGTAEYRVGRWKVNEDETETLIPVLGFLYSFNYERNKHEFFEDEKDDNDFFEHTYFDGDYTKDSIRFNQLSNVIHIKQYENQEKKFTFGKRVYLGHDLVRGSMPGELVENKAHFDYPYTIFGPDMNGWTPDSMVNRSDISYSNLYLGGGIFRETGNFWRWNFDGKIYLAGRSSGQFEINGDIQKPFTFLADSTASIRFTGAIKNLAPDYFQENFSSNRARWTNNFDMEQRITLGAEFTVPQRKLRIGGKYSIINNFFYNDTTGTPNQTSNEILVLSAYVDKDFNFRNLHFRTRVLWQKASDDKYLHLPDLSAFVSAYYQFTISKVLFTQIGSDVRYNTKYYADAYAPNTGLFYLQNETQYGNYPYIDVYASVRLKRTRVFFKMMNIGTNFLDGIYMTTPGYPMNRSTFRLGVSWAFYD
jgi:hypothetical protein